MTIQSLGLTIRTGTTRAAATEQVGWGEYLSAGLVVLGLLMACLI